MDFVFSAFNSITKHDNFGKKISQSSLGEKATEPAHKHFATSGPVAGKLCKLFHYFHLINYKRQCLRLNHIFFPFPMNNPQNKDNSLRPNFGRLPAVVEIDMMVRSMGPVSEIEMVSDFIIISCKV